MTRIQPPTEHESLFPDSWITGVAAAELARNDKDVLIDEVARAATPTPSAPDLGPRARGRPSEAELAELRREMQRLERQMEAMRRRPRYLECSAVRPGRALSPGQEEPEIPLMPPGEPPTHGPDRAARRRRIGRIPTVLIGALGVLAALAILVMALSLEFRGHPLGQRMQQVGQGLALRVERIGETLGAKADTVRGGLGELRGLAAALWDRPGGEQGVPGESALAAVPPAKPTGQRD
jgi:hypothetical protein